MPYRLRKRFDFPAAHSLAGHDGKCKYVHGHTWGLVVEVEGKLKTMGPKQGMVMDFGDIKSIVGEMLEEYFDHKYLNDTLNMLRPTSEYVASWIFRHLEPKLDGKLRSITVIESPTSECQYLP